MTQKVVVNGSQSNPKSVTGGVPQGSVLGSILFLIYINDLPEGVDCTMKLFADDSKLYANNSKIEDHPQLQNNMDAVCKWTDIWPMKLNGKKCKFMQIGKENNQGEYSGCDN